MTWIGPIDNRRSVSEDEMVVKRPPTIEDWALAVFLIAEARWWAADARSGWHIEDADGRTFKVGASLFPWEVVSGGA